jgi:hypothetical protein
MNDLFEAWRRLQRAVYRDSDRDHWVHSLLRKEDQCSMRCMNSQTRLQRPIAIYPRLNGEITALELNLPSPGVGFQYSYHEMFLTDWLLIAGLCHRCCMIERPMSNWPLDNVLVKPSRIVADLSAGHGQLSLSTASKLGSGVAASHLTGQDD